MNTISLRKMSNKLDSQNLASYSLKVIDDHLNTKSDEIVNMNNFIGSSLELEFTGDINCISCQRRVTKTFNQGYCFPCFQKLAECDICIVKPELCHFEEGTCRDNDFAEKNCNTDHYVYLSLTSGIKIGITRAVNLPHRWIDQGASQAIKVLKVNRRKDAGIIESEIAKSFADKTNWRKMLKNEAEPCDLIQQKQEILERAREIAAIAEIKIEESDDEITNIEYPVEEYPQKIKSHNFDKNPIVSGTLLGIKGQYLIFDTGVINIRKFAGYRVQIKG